MDTKRKTIGVDLKVPIGLVVSLVVWALLRFTGIDLSAQAETIAALIVGALAAAAGPAPKTVPVGSVATVEGGTSHTRAP